MLVTERSFAFSELLARLEEFTIDDKLTQQRLTDELKGLR